MNVSGAWKDATNQLYCIVLHSQYCVLFITPIVYRQQCSSSDAQRPATDGWDADDDFFSFLYLQKFLRIVSINKSEIKTAINESRLVNCQSSGEIKRPPMRNNAFTT